MKVLAAAAKACSRCQSNMQNVNVVAPLLTQSHHFRVAHICYRLDVFTLKLFFTNLRLGVGTYKPNLYYFHCNAGQNCKVLCHL